MGRSIQHSRSARRQFLSVLAVALLLPAVAFAQSGGAFTMLSHTYASGNLAQGGTYKLASAIGQPEALPAPMSGGVFDLTPGFLQQGDLFPLPVAVSVFTVE